MFDEKRHAHTCGSIATMHVRGRVAVTAIVSIALSLFATGAHAEDAGATFLDDEIEALEALDAHDAGGDDALIVHLRAHRRLLARAARDGAKLPDDDRLKKTFNVPNLLRTSLRERANEIRLARNALLAERTSLLDGGAPPADGGLSSPTVAPPTADEALLDDALDVLRRLIADSERGENAARAEREVARLATRARAAEELRLAEAARELALADAQSARTARLESLLEHAARIAGFTADLARARGELLESVETSKRELEEARARVLAAREEARRIADDDIDDALSRALLSERALLQQIADIRARKRNRAQTLERTAASVLSTVKERSSSAIVEEERGSLARLEAAAAHARTQLAEVLRLSAREEAELVREAITIVEGIDEVRLVLQAQSPLRVRSDLYRLSDLGVENLTVSLLHAFERIRVHVEHRVFQITHLDRTRASLLELGRFVLSFGWGLLLVFFAFVLWRRVPALWPHARTAVTKRVTTRESARLAAFFIDGLEALAPRAFLIVVVLWISGSIESDAPQPETGLLTDVALWVLGYQLVANVTHFAILRLTRGHVTLTAVIRLKILRSVRLVLRYALVALSLLSFLRTLVGADVLYHFARIAFIAGVGPVLLLLLVRWRESIIMDYLAHRPDGRLAHALEEHSGALYRTVLSVGALASVTAGGLVVFGRDFALGFEQTRKALAYLFRLRIERQAKTRLRVAFDPDSLPRPLVDACADRPLDNNTGLVTQRIESALSEANEILSMRRGRSVLVDAQWGMGLSTWLLHLERAVLEKGGASRHFRPMTRMTSPDDLMQGLASTFDPDGEACTLELETVVARALELDLDLVTVDGLEWLFLRELDGYRSLDALFEVIRRTRHRVSWVLGSSETTTSYLCQARRIDAQVSYRHTLPPWSEDEIRLLLVDRKRRSGLRVTYDELLVHSLDIASSEIVETEEDYTRLLWNFARGNPRIAQHFWLRSLVVKNEHEVSVRLYDAPSPDDLEVLPEGERFMLFATLLHRSLHHDEIARTCRLPLGSVDAHVSRGLDLGFYEMNASGAYSVTTAWALAVQRYLRRKNLL